MGAREISLLPSWRSRPEIIFLTVVLIALNLMILVWAGLSPTVSAVSSGGATVRPLAAVGLLVAGVVCLLCQSSDQRVVRVAGGLGAVLALCALAILVSDLGAAGETSWGRKPVPIVLAGFVAFGIGAALLSVPVRPALAVGFGLLAVVVTVALFRMFHWIAPPAIMDAPKPFNPINFIVAATFALVSVCTLWWHPHVHLRERFLRPNLGGRVLRYGVIMILMLPILADSLAWLLTRTMLWGHSLLFASTATLSVVGGGILVWWVSRLVDDLQARTRAEVVELARANEALERYASSTAHDLKAPIRHLGIYSELSIEAIDAGETDRAIKYARDNVQSSQTLLEMVDHLLSYARSAYRQLSLSDHRLSELVRAAMGMLARDVEAAGARVFVDADATIKCDGHLMESVFQNLLSNSIRYRGDTDALEVRVSAEASGSEWVICFADNGPGFDPAFAPKAFDPLSRDGIDSPDGNGIGLTTCRTILQNHGGEIRVDEAYSGGARIEMRLPRKPLSGSDQRLPSAA